MAESEWRMAERPRVTVGKWKGGFAKVASEDRRRREEVRYQTSEN